VSIRRGGENKKIAAGCLCTCFSHDESLFSLVMHKFIHIIHRKFRDFCEQLANIKNKVMHGWNGFHAQGYPHDVHIGSDLFLKIRKLISVTVSFQTLRRSNHYMQ
jgi:hypothetical protein